HGPPGLCGAIHTSNTLAAGAAITRVTVTSITFIVIAPFWQRRILPSDRGAHSRTARSSRPSALPPGEAPRITGVCSRGRDGYGERGRRAPARARAYKRRSATSKMVRQRQKCARVRTRAARAPARPPPVVYELGQAAGSSMKLAWLGA